MSAKLATDPRAGRRLLPWIECGRHVWRRTAIVDVVLPNFQPRSASLSQLTFFVSRTRRGWVAWERAH